MTAQQDPAPTPRKRGAHRSSSVAGNQKFLRLTAGQAVLLIFAILMIATVVLSVYIGKHI